MNANQSEISRRQAIAVGTALVARTALGAMIVTPLRVGAKAAKADFYYQERAKDGKSCSTCRLFAPTESGRGTCAVVEGDVSSTGWCLAYSPRT